MRLAVSFFCAAAAFAVQWREQWVPAKPSADRIAWEHDRSWFHNMKNLWTETVRADCEYWGKALSFAVVSLSLALAVLIAS